MRAALQPLQIQAADTRWQSSLRERTCVQCHRGAIRCGSYSAPCSLPASQVAAAAVAVEIVRRRPRKYSVPPTTGTVVGSTTPPPVNGARAVATFESIGLYWTPPSNPGADGCSVIFRKVGDSTWRQGLDMWYDARNNECRGSLVHARAGHEL